MKRTMALLTAVSLLAALAACSPKSDETQGDGENRFPDATSVELYDNGVLVDGAAAPSGPDTDGAVYVDHDVIFYLADQGTYYGAGTQEDEHTQEEADAHTVVHITQPGAYRLSGTLSAGQIFVDLGEDAKEDPEAVVTLILDGANVTCTVAPAIFFYSVYECGNAEEDGGAVVDTTAAGANVILADGTTNDINGAYVARIYASYELASDGVTVESNKKLHKYDGAFYSKMSMNINGDTEGTGELNIVGAREGMDSELHLTINGGILHIDSQDDGINTNEDGISVTTVNGGSLTVNGGLGEEGDGIDSNGYLTINGGTVIATANGRTGDGGIDADKDILINGGTVIALGSRNDATSSDSKQMYMELSFAATQAAGTTLAVKDESGTGIAEYTAQREYQSATISTPELAADTTYQVLVNDVQQQYTGNQSGMMGGPGGMGGGQKPDGGEAPQGQPGQQPPENGQMPEPTGDGQPTDGGERPQRPDGMTPPEGGTDGKDFPAGGMESGATVGEGQTDFVLSSSVRSFSGVSDSNAAGKTRVTFSVNDGKGLTGTSSGVELTGITATAADGSAGPTEDMVQITITDLPSESYGESCLLSDGLDAIAQRMPTEKGTYQMTVAVKSEDSTYTGTTQWIFTIGDGAENTAG